MKEGSFDAYQCIIVSPRMTGQRLVARITIGEGLPKLLSRPYLPVFKRRELKISLRFLGCDIMKDGVFRAIIP